MLIGDVARQAGISTRMLRHYDEIGVVSPTGRTAGGYRDYTDADIRRLFHVESLRSLGLPLHEVKRALDDATLEPSRLLDDLIARTRDRIEHEEHLLARLREVRNSDVAQWTDVPRIVEIIRELRADDPSRRQRGALSSAGIDGRLSGPLADALLRESDPNAAGALQWALARFGEEALDVLVPALNAGDPEVRRRAIAALAKLPSEHATAALTAALDDEDAGARHAATLALGRRADPAATEALLTMVVDGVNDVEAAELLGALAVKHDNADHIVASIVRQLERGPADARPRLTQALADIPGEAATRALGGLRNDADARVARTASYVLDRLRPP